MSSWFYWLHEFVSGPFVSSAQTLPLPDTASTAAVADSEGPRGLVQQSSGRSPKPKLFQDPQAVVLRVAGTSTVELEVFLSYLLWNLGWIFSQIS